MKHLPFMTFIIIGLVIAFASLLEAKTHKSDAYRLGISDEIAIQVLGHEDLSMRAIVAIDGTIPFPNIGPVYVKDKTLQEVENEITRKLSEGYIKYPVVSVSLVRSLSKRVFIHGEVVQPGILPFEKDMTIVHALSMAGGIREDGLYGKLRIRRKEEGGLRYKTIGESGLDKGIIKSREIEDMFLQPDDIVIVERGETYFIEGEVRRTGQYRLENNVTVGRAITLAGGISEGGLYGKVKVRRKGDGDIGYKTIGESGLDKGIIKSREIEDMFLQPDDIVIVERSETYFIEGEVERPGHYVLGSNVTVGRAITLAGGIRDGGIYGKVKVRRKEKGGLEYKTIGESGLNKGIIKSKDVEGMFLQPDDIVIVERSERIFIEGEVVRPGPYVLEDGMTVSRGITLAGGISEGGLYGKVKVRRKREGGPGFDDIEIDLKAIIEGSVKEDMLLQPDDIVIVERSKTFLIYGEVNRIGVFPLEKDMTVFKALTIAGGLSKWGSASGVKVLRPTNDGKSFVRINVNINEVLDGNAAADILLQPGDIIVVTSRIF